MQKPEQTDYCKIDPSSKSVLHAVIDTEEQFDWSHSFSRNSVGVEHMHFIGRVQEIFDQYGIVPVYVVDYPVASKPEGYLPLREIHSTGRCVIGAHLHPWVTPPFQETVSRRNSFPGNLPLALETAKLETLSECIYGNLGIRPTIYKAGRYGIGPNTFDIIENLGFQIDVSVCPHVDYSDEEGPDFTFHTSWPYWFGKKRRLLELPKNVGYVGRLRKRGVHLHRMAKRPIFEKAHLPGILARSGMLNKVWLSPEGYTVAEQIELVRSLYRDGLRIFSWAFHSPSVEPGNTPYVQSCEDLDRFLSGIRQFFDFFMGEFGGRPATPMQIRDTLLVS
jgi:hypothetical protein